MLKDEGMNVTVFGSHLTRSASIVNCQRKGVFMKEVNKAARWSSSDTFAKHYNKPIVDENGSFLRTVLESQSC